MKFQYWLRPMRHRVQSAGSVTRISDLVIAAIIRRFVILAAHIPKYVRKATRWRW